MPSSLERAGRSVAVRRVLFVILAVLAMLTAYQYYRSRTAYELSLYKTPMGWGYDVLNHGNLIIHQPAIPGIAGDRGFADEAQARRVGERVISKLQQGRGMPAITQEELRAMNVSLP
ncbi:DUF4907 domain-containing protein [Spirosoma rhododendri]|uniref:DUF4907 domain-containing protein n=1 Tax=Spirosoma rhododendri TaxID=2728024 RepID=A0A7L5DHW1_9BACT|nr:DUF4907 domain-containing protein [Spirosoma rhododendri]QJD77916.1 DUF4907 domain-containing protein [Spirosoma rhododendri]